jgi:hypothetical protein
MKKFSAAETPPAGAASVWRWRLKQKDEEENETDSACKKKSFVIFVKACYFKDANKPKGENRWLLKSPMLILQMKS